MIRGFYTAVSGLVAAMTRQSIVADEIANVNTVGYKASRSTQAEFGLDLGVTNGASSQAIGHLGTATYAVEQPLDTSQGTITTTDRATDLAIEGDGLFAVSYGNGYALTRAGNFTIDANGHLANEDGLLVLDTTAKPITVPNGQLQVGSDGTVVGTNQRIAVVAWPAGGVDRLGSNLYSPTGALTLSNATIHQYALERSNVDMATAMTELMILQRQFQFASKSLGLQEDTITDASQLGRLK